MLTTKGGPLPQLLRRVRLLVFLLCSYVVAFIVVVVVAMQAADSSEERQLALYEASSSLDSTSSTEPSPEFCGLALEDFLLEKMFGLASSDIDGLLDLDAHDSAVSGPFDYNGDLDALIDVSETMHLIIFQSSVFKHIRIFCKLFFLAAGRLAVREDGIRPSAGSIRERLGLTWRLWMEALDDIYLPRDGATSSLLPHFGRSKLTINWAVLENYLAAFVVEPSLHSISHLSLLSQATVDSLSESLVAAWMSVVCLQHEIVHPEDHFKYLSSSIDDPSSAPHLPDPSGVTKDAIRRFVFPLWTPKSADLLKNIFYSVRTLFSERFLNYLDSFEHIVGAWRITRLVNMKLLRFLLDPSSCKPPKDVVLDNSIFQDYIMKLGVHDDSFYYYQSVYSSAFYSFYIDTCLQPLLKAVLQVLKSDGSQHSLAKLLSGNNMQPISSSDIFLIFADLDSQGRTIKSHPLDFGRWSNYLQDLLRSFPFQIRPSLPLFASIIKMAIRGF